MKTRFLNRPLGFISIIVITLVILAAVYYIFIKKSTIAPTAPSAALVQVTTVKAHTIPLTLSAVGTVISPKTVMLKAQQAGIITAIYFHSGQQVIKGQLLLQIDDSKQKAALAQAQANLFSLEADYKRNLQMAKNDSATVSPNTLDQKLGAVEAAQALVASAKEELLETQVRAPFSGQIAALESINNSTDVAGTALNQSTQVARGGYVAEGDNIVLLTDPSHILIQYQLPQEYSSRMALGQQVTIQSPSDNSKAAPLSGQVSYISPTLLTDSHAYLARATIHAPQHSLAPGMAVMLTQTLDSHHRVLAVPGISLIPSLTGFSVYMIENNKVKAVPVTTAGRDNTWVAITQGLKPGDQIISAGLQEIHPGALVKITHTNTV